jgi:hypothetical protein
MKASNIQFEFIILSFQVILCFLSEIQPNCPRNHVHHLKNMHVCPTCEIYKVGLHLEILTIL